MFRRLETTGITNTTPGSGLTPSLFSNSDGLSQRAEEWGRVKAIISLAQLEAQPKLGDKPRATALPVSTHQDADEQESALCTVKAANGLAVSRGHIFQCTCLLRGKVSHLSII